MQGLATIVVSLGFIFATSFVLMSCLSCRKFIAKRKLKKQKKKQETVNIPEIKIELGESHPENGIANPVYQENEETKAEEQQPEANISVEENKETKTEGNDLQGGQIKEELEADEKVESAASVDPARNPTLQDIDEEEVPDTSEKNEDWLDVESEESEPIEIDAEEVIETRDEEQNSRAESTQLLSNILSEEDLQAYDDIVFQGEWRHPVALRHLLEIGIIDKETADEIVKETKSSKKTVQTDNVGEEEEVPEKLKRYLRGEEPIAGILVADSGEKKSIFKSAKEGILRRGTAISLLEAQAATGNIIDPVTGRKMSVKEAAQLGLLDKVYETILLRAERAVTGYKFRASDHILTLCEAMQKGLVVESHGLRLLGAQCATGGVIDHNINIRIPLDIAIKRGLLDEKFKHKLEDEGGEETKTFFDPNTEQNVTYKELMRRSIVDNDTGLRLYPLEKIAKKRFSYGSYSGRSSLSSSRTVSRSNSRENIPAALAYP